MASPPIIIPVKGKDPKTRLSKVLTSTQRTGLVIAMLEDILQTLREGGFIRETFVISCDKETLRFVERYGANSILEDSDQGVNRAVEFALSVTRQYQKWMIIPSDIPFITVRDIKAVLMLKDFGAGPVISPSLDLDGTNLLLMEKGSRIALHFDQDSFVNHVREALARSYLPALYYSDSVALDIDNPKDLEGALRVGARNCTTTFIARKLRNTGKVESRMRLNDKDSTDREL